MAMETPPKAELTLNTTQAEYTKACLLASRRIGALRPLPLMVLLAAGLLFAGLSSMSWFQARYQTILIPLALCVSCPLLLLFFFWMEPNTIKKRAVIDFKTYQALMDPAVLRLYADNAVTESATLTLTDSYALILGCIETPDLFVFLKDRERLLILPKRCIPSDQAEEIMTFLRLVFARRRHLMNNWIF